MENNKTNRLGETNYNQHGTLMKIIKYNSYNDIDVEFQDEYKYVAKNMRYDYFREGRLQNPFDKTVYGIGYLGKNYITRTRDKNKESKAYNIWSGMLERCYNPKYQEKKPTYKGCYVCDEWLNFSTFKKWYEENIYEIENDQIHLDKDIINKGNKCYCPQYCVFVPRRINSLFTKNNKLRGNLPIGINLDRTTYRTRLSTLNGRIDLGHYNNIDEAFQAYKVAKENYIKQVADEYKDKIPYRLYEAMYNYEVEITD